MLIHTIIDELASLKLTGMLEALSSIQQGGSLGSISFTDGLGILVTQEKLHRQNKRLKRLLQQAKLRFSQACMEDIDYHYPRNLDKHKMQALVSCQWIQEHKNLIFIGATGLGKSYLACALGAHACRHSFSTRYLRVSKLLEMLRLANIDTTLNRLLIQWAKINVLIFDDWGIEPLSVQQRNQLLEIIEDRHQLQSCVITTQLPIEHWHNHIGDNTVADAILDRLLSNAEVFTLKGKSMRRQGQQQGGHTK